MKPACEGLHVLKAKLNLPFWELSDLFGLDCGRSDDSVDDLVASDEARGTFVGVMIRFEQCLDELGILQQKWSLGGHGTEVGNDGIDDDS